MIAGAVLKVRARAGAHASICVIGDTPADVMAARDNGLAVIAVATGIFSEDELAATAPDLVIASLNQLLAIQT